MPTLEWIGKDKVVNHHQQVPFRVLERQYTYGGDDSDNMIIHGDNLEALKSLLPQYEGKIKCIYILRPKHPMCPLSGTNPIISASTEIPATTSIMNRTG